jgi:hypothetical protein
MALRYPALFYPNRLPCRQGVADFIRNRGRIAPEYADYAVKMGLAVHNVAKVVESPRVAKVTMNTLSQEEVERFLKAARALEHGKPNTGHVEREPRSPLIVLGPLLFLALPFLNIFSSLFEYLDPVFGG